MLAESKEPLTMSYIGNKLNVSSRTVKRKMTEIEDYLIKHGFKLITKPGYGVEIEGDLNEKNRLKQLINEETFEKKYTPEERQLYILIELLKGKEPIKMYKFKSDLNVTEGTISFDLDKVEDILCQYNIRLIRRPGVGVYIEGEESNLRRLIINIIYENNYQNQLLEILGNAIQNKNIINKSIRLSTKNKLLNMIDKDTISEVEKVVHYFENNKKLILNDSQYVALIVHLALVVERIKNGDKIYMRERHLNNLKKKKEFNMARGLANEIENSFGINMPDDEIGYITMHLLGSKKYFDYKNSDLNDFLIDNYQIIETSKALIEYVQKESNTYLLQDDKILVNLAIHLEPAIKRMIMGMEIRNPLLNEIMENYPQIFNLSKKASSIIEKEFNVKVPDAEVGYIALHIGGALERVNNYIYKVVVICPSGIGASRLLSTKISNEFFNIEVMDTVSALEANKYDFSRCDFIITTVPINVKKVHWILVNPLLLEEDKDKIKTIMTKIPLGNKEIKNENIEEKGLKQLLTKQINYSRAIIQVLDNYRYHEVMVNNYKELIDKISKTYTANQSGFNNLKRDILEREKLGQVILEESNTAIFHCRTKEVEELQIGIFNLLKPLIISDKTIKTAAILLAPKDIDAEYIEVMSYITQSIFKGELIKTIEMEEVYRNLNNILESFYNNIK